MKRYAIISSGFKPVPAIKGGGVEQLISTIIDYNELSNDVIIDLYTISDNGLNDLSYKNTNIIQVDNDSLNNLFALIFNKITKLLHLKIFINSYDKKVAKLVSFKKYDSVIVENNFYLYKKIYKKYKYNTKYFFHLHNEVNNYYKPVNLCKFVSKTANKIICVSDFIAKQFVQYTKCDIEKIKVLYNCVQIHQFQENKNDRELVRKNTNVSKSDFVILYCGRFSQEKGLLYLLNAFEGLSYSNVKLFLVGDEITQQSFFLKKMIPYKRKILSKINGNSKIINIGYVDHSSLSKYYNAADVVVIPSICNEAFGLVAVEAVACKKFVIASDKGGLPEVLNRNFAFLLNTSNIEQELTSSLIYCYNNKAEITNRGKKMYAELIHNNSFLEENYYSNFMSLIEE